MHDLPDFLVYLPIGEWESNTRQKMLLAVSDALRERQPRAKMLCLERPVCLATSPLREGRRFGRWLRGERRLRQINDNLYVGTPWVPLHDRLAAHVPLLPRLNQYILRRYTRSALKRLSMRVDMLASWVFHPYQVSYLDVVPSALSVYECYDAYDEFASVAHNPREQQRIRDMERALMGRASLVLTTGRNLYEARRARHSNVRLVPNGVSFEHFARATARPEPEDMRSIPKPILGFVGNINEQIDYPLVTWLARRHPDWSFVVIGRYDGLVSLQRRADFKEWVALPNVHRLGWKDFADLPRYVANFQVGLIPFVINELTRQVYPLKLHEYLACGLPVVSTDMEEVRPFGDFACVARTREEFERGIETSLREASPALRERRVAVASAHSWSARAQDILRALDDTVERLRNPAGVVAEGASHA
ncbi:MAG: glycosyltransferase [Chloroflexota bacterium]